MTQNESSAASSKDAGSVGSAATAVREMLEPCGEFPSRLEWLAFWLDGMDSILGTVNKEPMGTDVQRDLRRWAVMLRGE